MFIMAFAKALRNLMLPGIMKLFLICLLAYVVGWGALSWGFSALISSYIDVAGTEGFFMRFLSGAGGMVIAWFLFPLLYPILISFFDDQMVTVIEREDYPQLSPAQPPFWPTVMNDVLFSLKAIGLNILCLPVYLVPLVGIMVYYGLNGYLLGTQFFRMVAGRRMGAPDVEALQKHAFRSILMTGVAISFCATIPLLNLAAPLVGVASMLHLFHALRGTARQEILPP